MHVILSAILLALAILDLVIGTGFLMDPASSGTDFGLSIASTHGESTLRGDMTAFFYVTAISLASGAWKRRGDMLFPALGLFGIAFTGRFVNVVTQGTYDGWLVPMGVEALHCIAIVIAMRTWGWPKAGA
ncbi:hypothetical protein [Qipengyuania qiaonensis]|uniref:DUF4345 domain-containing protein n=1 Tax=Qipengyuania qiaonensis TaxID=2867240 RepID=A0ABS7J3X6_9SPHN|nr:hypothetical protein [Qipengyuania qiaonensis]MBX7481986.1 hypothetical protein [Qipengyuania qiaonensis]